MLKGLATVLVFAVSFFGIVAAQTAKEPTQKPKQAVPIPSSPGVFTGTVSFYGLPFMGESLLYLKLHEDPGKQDFRILLDQAVSLGLLKEVPLEGRDMILNLAMGGRGIAYAYVDIEGWKVQITCEPPRLVNTCDVKTLKVLSRLKAPWAVAKAKAEADAKAKEEKVKTDRARAEKAAMAEEFPNWPQEVDTYVQGLAPELRESIKNECLELGPRAQVWYRQGDSHYHYAVRDCRGIPEQEKVPFTAAAHQIELREAIKVATRCPQCQWPIKK
jgi:hypothetical protein